MKVHYDLHIHSCLSPCGDEEMTPNNIVNMALLAGLDMIALTDHNSCKNCPALLQAAKKAGLTAIAGMELCTAEECHIVCLFPTLETAMAFDSYVEKSLSPLKNRSDIFGEQCILDENDRKTGSEEKLLASASAIGVDDVAALVGKFNGTAFPAHIDRPSYSVTAVLGTVPSVGFHAVEVSQNGDIAALQSDYAEIQGKPVLFNSDAHYLEQIQEAGPWLELPDMTPETLIAALNGEVPCAWGR